MNEARRLHPIEGQITDGHLAVPHGMKPIYLHNLDDRPIAHVEGWTTEKEYENSRFDLYQLNNARRFIVHLKINVEEADQEWYEGFGEPTKEATRLHGEWNIRERSHAAM